MNFYYCSNSIYQPLVFVSTIRSEENIVSDDMYTLARPTGTDVLGATASNRAVYNFLRKECDAVSGSQCEAHEDDQFCSASRGDLVNMPIYVPIGDTEWLPIVIIGTTTVQFFLFVLLVRHLHRNSQFLM